MTAEEIVRCELCGAPMPPGEEMLKYHGYSGPCPKPPLPKPAASSAEERFEEALAAFASHEHEYGECDGGDVAWGNCPARTALRSAHAACVEEARLQHWDGEAYERGLREGAEREREAIIDDLDHKGAASLYSYDKSYGTIREMIRARSKGGDSRG